jgi:hypothetical protein
VRNLHRGDAEKTFEMQRKRRNRSPWSREISVIA